MVSVVERISQEGRVFTLPTEDEPEGDEEMQLDSSPLMQPQPQIATCGACRKPGGDSGLLWCSRCGTVQYCSRECQLADWKSHKKACRMAGQKNVQL